ncbi:hypothetical protein BHE74_00053840, partial [Ensete ventricosum]
RAPVKESILDRCNENSLQSVEQKLVRHGASAVVGGAEVVVGQRKRVWWHRTWRLGPGGLDGPSDWERPQVQRLQSSRQGHTIARSKGTSQEKESDGGSHIHKGGGALGRDWVQGVGGRKRRYGGCSRRSRGCSVSVALRKKMLATLEGHKRLRAAAATTVAAKGDMCCDYRGSSSGGHKGSFFGRVGEKLSLDSEEIRCNLS